MAISAGDSGDLHTSDSLSELIGDMKLHSLSSPISTSIASVSFRKLQSSSRTNKLVAKLSVLSFMGQKKRGREICLVRLFQTLTKIDVSRRNRVSSLSCKSPAVIRTVGFKAPENSINFIPLHFRFRHTG